MSTAKYHSLSPEDIDAVMRDSVETQRLLANREERIAEMQSLIDSLGEAYRRIYPAGFPPLDSDQADLFHAVRALDSIDWTEY